MSFKETLYAVRSQARPAMADRYQHSTSLMFLCSKSDSHTYHILLQWEIELACSDLHVIVLI